jgi:hypothetical protein
MPFCHRKSGEEARALWSALQERFAACKPTTVEPSRLSV